MNEKLYPIVILICIMLISLILAFADYIDGNVQISDVKWHQKSKISHFLASQTDFYSKAIYLLNDINNNALKGFKWLLYKLKNIVAGVPDISLLTLVNRSWHLNSNMLDSNVETVWISPER